MRYRQLDANRDMTFGLGGLNFLTNTPATVAQAILTRLLLITGEWFLDVTEGTDYGGAIVGNHSQAEADAEIRRRILGTQGVTALVSYSSTLANRKLTVAALVDTVYGQAAPIQVTIP